MSNKSNPGSKRPSAKLVLAMAIAATAGAAANASAELHVKDTTNAVLSAANVVENKVSAVSNAATAIKMHYVIDELKKIGGPDGPDSYYNITKNFHDETKNFHNEQNDYSHNIEEHNNYIKTITTINNNYYEGDVPIIVDPIEDFRFKAGEYAVNYNDAGHYQSMDVRGLISSTNDISGSESQKKANAVLLDNLALQQTRLIGDKSRLQSLQNDAVNVVGHAKQMQYANMLAAEQSNQLMQLRALTLAEQNAEAARAQVVADREAREMAAAQILRGSLPEVSATSSLGVVSW